MYSLYAFVPLWSHIQSGRCAGGECVMFLSLFCILVIFFFFLFCSIWHFIYLFTTHNSHKFINYHRNHAKKNAQRKIYRNHKMWLCLVNGGCLISLRQTLCILYRKDLLKAYNKFHYNSSKNLLKLWSCENANDLLLVLNFKRGLESYVLAFIQYCAKPYAQHNLTSARIT